MVLYTWFSEVLPVPFACFYAVLQAFVGIFLGQK
jgi:hypothetical protein